MIEQEGLLDYARETARLACAIFHKEPEMNLLVKEVARATANASLSSWCLYQLPAGIRDKFLCIVATDAYMLNPVATFKRVGTNTEYSVRLEGYTLENVELNIALPQEFIAKLCVVA